MNINKKIISLFLTFAIVFSIIPTINANASANENFADIKIISDTKVTVKEAKKWAESKGATNTFINLADLYWKYAQQCGNVNPALAYVQSAKETGYGKFGGVLNETYNNPCGMKTSQGGGDFDQNAHTRFNSWDEGVQAHLDHLALYAGAKGYPKANTYDPRHFVSIKGIANTVNSLGGKWAPSATYGKEVNSLYNNLLAYSGIDSEYEKNTKPEGSGSSNEEYNPEFPVPGTKPSVPEISKPNQSSKDDNNISSSIGWKQQYGSWYYYKSDGIKATGWINPDGNWYYLYSDGSMATGWFKNKEKWYYLQSWGGMQKGWLKDNGKWYYLQGDGTMVTGFNSINGNTYFFDISGSMRVGWFEISGNWHYFNTDGSMLTGWIKPYDKWYYLYSNGAMAKGWIKLNGDKWYYLNSNGDMATGWTRIGNDTYYLNLSSGEMVKDTVIDGFKIESDGKAEKRSDGLVPGGSSNLIVIDPGHNYGGDDGAYATHNRITYSERDLNMQLAIKLKVKLEASGYKVVMTRNETDRETLNVTQSLTKRVEIANNLNAGLFISIHHNSASEVSARGVETYYSTRAQDSNFGGGYSEAKITKSRTLATNITNSIVNSTGAVNRGGKDGNLFVCRNTKMPSVLVESGFISNPTEASNCADSNYQYKIADGIAKAVSSEF